MAHRLSPRRHPVFALRPVARLLAAVLAATGSCGAAAQNALPVLPGGGVVRSGDGRIVRNEAGTVLTVQQSSARLALDWSSFGIGRGATVEFRQPSATSVALNRVTGDGLSRIDGTLRANGQVFLLNPNGVLFGSAAQVDVGALVASSLTMGVDDFDAGRWTLRRGERAGAVENEGSIAVAGGGSLALIAPQVVNRGRLAAPGGEVTLLAAREVTIDPVGDGLLRFGVTQRAVDAVVAQHGEVAAARVVASALAASVVNQDGDAVASVAIRDPDLDGGVRFVAAGTLELGGTVQAAQQAYEARSIALSGRLDASGPTGGVVDLAAGSIEAWSAIVLADGESGPGGTIRLRASGGLGLDYSRLSASSSADAGAGGLVQLQAHDLWLYGSQLGADGPAGGGRLALAGERDVALYGSLLSASAGSGRGGLIEASAAHVGVRSSTLRADGATGGGALRLGRGVDGMAAPFADVVEVAPMRDDEGGDALRPSLFSADATQRGHGGEVVVAGATDVWLAGELRARSGVDGGDGGRIAVATGGTLDLQARPDAAARAAGGAAGQLVIEAPSLRVQAEADCGCDILVASAAAEAPPAPVAIAAALVQDVAGAGTAVELRTPGTLEVDAPIDIGGAAAALTLRAGRSLTVRADIASANGDLALHANDRAAPLLFDTPAASDGAAGLSFASQGDWRPGLAAGSGRVTLAIGTAGPAGAMQLNGVAGGAIELHTQALPEGHDLWLNGTLAAGGTGDALVVDAHRITVRAGLGDGVFATPQGRWLVYGDRVAGHDLGGLASPGNLFGRRFGDDPPASIDATFGSRLVYAERPVLTVRPLPASALYGVGEIHFGWITDGLVGGDRVDTALRGEPMHDGGAQPHAGRYTIGAGTLADQLGYRLEVVPAAFDVLPRPVTLQVVSAERAYGSADPSTVALRLVDGSAVFGDRLVATGAATTLAPTAHAGDSGALRATGVTPTGGVNDSRPGDYAVTLRDGTLTVTPRVVTVRVDDQRRAYGEANPTRGATTLVDGSFAFGDNLTATALRSDLAATAHAGDAGTLQADGFTLDGGRNASRPGDYRVTLLPGTLTVTPRVVTVRVDDRQRAYGDADPTRGATTLVDGSFAFGDSLTATPLRSDLPATAHAGDSGALNADGFTLDGGRNASRPGDYRVTLLPGLLTVTPRIVTVRVDDQQRAYGDTDPTRGATTLVDGSFAFGDSLTATPLRSDLAATAHAGDSGTLQADGFTLDGGRNASRPGDYRVTLLPGTLTVTPRAVTVRVDDQQRAYGDADPIRGTTTLLDGSLAFGDGVTATPLRSDLASTAHAGETGALNAEGFTLDGGGNASRPGDYRVTLLPGTLSVTPRPLTVQVDDQGRVFGAANPTAGSGRVLSGSFAFGDALGPLTVDSPLAPDAPLGAEAPLAGRAAVLVAGSNASTWQDYAVTWSPGRLAVDALPATTPQAGTPRVPPAVDVPLPPAVPAEPAPVFQLAQADGTLAYAPEAFLAAVQARRESFTELLAGALQTLRRDPSAADLPPCPDGTEDRRGVSDDLCMPDDRMQLAVQGDDLEQHVRDGVGEIDAPPTASGPAPTPAPAPVPAPAIQRKRAYLVGINAYTGEIPRLRTPVADAQAIGRELAERFGYEVELVRNATRRDMVGLFRRIVDETGADDSVLVYYAGHGYEVEETRAGYWIPSDASPDDPSTWISNADIARFLSRIRSRQVILVSDSCFSGSLAREERLDPTQVARHRDQILAGRSVVVMSSGGDEPVFDGGGQGHSIFARSLLDTLREQSAAPGWQVGNRVYAEVRERIESRYPQYPRYGAARSAGHRTGGDYMFEPRPAAAATGEPR